MCPHRQFCGLLLVLLPFLQVFGVESNQHDVYEEAVRPIVEDVCRGYNGTVMAYGQTGGPAGAWATVRVAETPAGGPHRVRSVAYRPSWLAPRRRFSSVYGF